MHELSITYELVQIAHAAAVNAGATRVNVVHLRLGVMAGVVKDSLLFGYDIATEGTLLEGSRLVVIDVPVILHCPTCNQDSQIDDIQMFICPHCGTPTADLRQGREIEIESIEITTEEDTHEPTAAFTGN